MFSRRLFDKRAAVLAAVLVAVGCGEDRSEIDSANLVDADLAPVVSWLTDESDIAMPVVTSNVSTDQPPVSSMIEGLEAKLADSPDDVKGWTLLAQSYAYVGQMSDARTAAKKAVDLGANESALQAKIESAHTGLAH